MNEWRVAESYSEVLNMAVQYVCTFLKTDNVHVVSFKSKVTLKGEW